MSKKEINNAVGSKTIDDIERQVSHTEHFKEERKEGLSIYHVAHDLKGLIAKISGLNSLLAVKLAHQPASDLHEFSRMINTVCEQGNNMLNDFIFNDKLNQKKNYSQTCAWISINDLVKHQSQIHYLLAKSKDIEINLSIPSEDNFCFVNPDDIKRVIDNLLSNAIKFTLRKGFIQVKLHALSNSVVIEITDSGIGIPATLQKELFLPYSNAKRLGTENEPTTGLGLAIIKKIVEINKGLIILRSDENSGTTISIEFKRKNKI
ncbi:MAG: HAMP domain-containing histidine kinase [Bacteroidetes bacterium]|nr:HAMP domain-containing histidine kinase [Bacteroidota bacterium]